MVKVSGLMELGKEYRSMLIRAVIAEQQCSELEDLLYAWFVEKRPEAETFLREFVSDAEMATAVSVRRATGRAAA